MNLLTSPIHSTGLGFQAPGVFGLAGIKKTVGDNILRLLDGRPDLNKSRLAKACGKSKATITHWIQGEALPEADALESIARTFNCRVHQLFLPWDEWGKPPKDPATLIEPEEALRIYLKSIGFGLSRLKKGTQGP